jgi:hypothetical protein
MADEFVAYVDDSDLHDGTVVAVSHDGTELRVEAVGGSGQRYEVFFIGVESVMQRRAEGMRLYALSEMRSKPPLRRFVFSNWDEEDDAALEVHAKDLTCTALPD